MNAPAKKAAARPNRPTLVKQETRASKQKQDDLLDIGFNMKVDGETYSVKIGEINALQSRMLKKVSGFTFPQLLLHMATDETDLDAFATAIWFARYTSGEENLQLDDVAKDITYATLSRVELDDLDDEDDDNPEA